MIPSSLLIKLSSAQKPFEEWTAQEVMEWMEKKPDFQDEALRAKFFFTGEAIASLTKEDFQKEIGNLPGAVLYNAVQELKSPTQGWKES